MLYFLKTFDKKTRNKAMKKITAKTVTVCLLLSISALWATVESLAATDLISYQGVLSNSGGNPVADGSYDMTFRVYDMENGGNLLWEEDQAVPTINGIYNVLLGSGTTINGSFDPSLFSSNTCWLEVEVNDEILSSRLQVTSVPFSFLSEEANYSAVSGDADTVDGAHAEDFAWDGHTHPGGEITSQVSDADTVDGAHAGDLEESAEIDADIAAHGVNPSAHHTRYSDLEAQGAMGTTQDSNPLNHHRYTDGEAFSAAAGVDAGTLDGLDSTAFASSSHTHAYSGMTIVAKSGGDYKEPRTAMNDLGSWCGTPDAANPCLVRIMPGVYDMRNNALTMEPYVDIEGSGENITTITSAHSSGTSDAASATVVGADNAEIRFLTVANRGGSTYSLAFHNHSASPKITNVTIAASGGTNNRGVNNLSSSSPIMTNVTATVSGGTTNYGLYNTLSSPTMSNVTAKASGGTNTNGGVYNGTSFPIMTNVTATASGGANAYGVRNYGSSPFMTNVTASASGADNNRGVLNAGTSLPVMINVTATASGGTDNRGVYNASSSPVMTNTIATASGGMTSYGVYNNISSFPTMNEVTSNGIVINGSILFVPASNDASANGVLLLAVENEIAGMGAASETNRYLIKLDAGIYDLGNNGFAMQPYVDIEGSGENTTTITSTHSSGTSPNSATVVGAENAEIRMLTVENEGGSSYAIAIYNYEVSPKITNVTASVSGGTNNRCVFNHSASPAMTNVTVTASGGTNNRAVYNYSSSPTMTNVKATASGGSFCYGVRNETSSAPIMTNITVTASGGTNNYGVSNYSSSPVMANVTATASGGTTNGGVNNISTSSPIMKEVLNNGILINGNILFVPAFNDALANGVLLLSVDNEIASMGAASETNRYMIKLDAGVYDLGNNCLTMQPYVDIEGSGENITTITSTHSSNTRDASSATVVGAENTEIRMLTVENEGGSNIAIAIYNYEVSPKIMNVTATVSGGTNNYGVANHSASSPAMTNVIVTASGGSNNRAIYNFSSSPTMIHITATATGGTLSTGITNDTYASPIMANITVTASGGTTNNGVSNITHSSPIMTNLTATAEGGTSNSGMWNWYSYPTIEQCRISGTNSILNEGDNTVKLSTTMLEGPVVGNGFTCVGAYDADFNALGVDCL